MAQILETSSSLPSGAKQTRTRRSTAKKAVEQEVIASVPSEAAPVAESPAPAKKRPGRKPKPKEVAVPVEEITDDLEGADDDAAEWQFAEGNDLGDGSRKPVGPPAVITKDMTLLEYLEQCNPPLDKKIIDIACAKSFVIGDLRKDAAQEIRLIWSRQKPNTVRYKPGQIASYANRMARNACLMTRRELGSAVRLPGSAFRQRRDGTSYVSPGVLATALDWNSIESWMLTGGEQQGADFLPTVSLEMDGVLQDLEGAGELALGDDEEAKTIATRMALLDTKKDFMTTRQYAILKSLIEGAQLSEVMEEHGIKRGILIREVNIASGFFGPDFLKTA